MTNIIEVVNLKKYFSYFGIKGRDFVKAVDGISLEVKKGEVYGFLGPNGAGKTTTIRCIMDFIHPTSGSIKVLGKDAHKDSVFLKKKIGYLPGNVRLYDKWTGQEHIDFVESLRGKSKFVEDLKERFNFDPGKKFKTYSSGNKQKLGLILTLMHEPELIIMDEPTLGLDPLLQNEIYEIFDELQKKGHTVFVSSHNLPEVERICNRVGIIKEGKIVGIEKVGELGEKRLRKVTVRFDVKFKKADFEFDGVEKIEEISDGLILTVRGDINPIVKKLASYKLHDLEISHATLEDVFLEFYKGKNNV
ncbi:MAG: ABC transporter ATP-binding protein [Actinobacteria bacterium]|nr:ABC transporter ATP-binding protein [Actinomycetota bacterium]